MPRGYIVKGQPGELVGHPRQALGERRFIGKIEKSPEALAALATELGIGVGELELPERYADIEEWCDHPDMQRIALKHKGVIVAGPVDSRARLDLAKAKALVAKSPAPRGAPKSAASAARGNDQ